VRGQSELNYFRRRKLKMNKPVERPGLQVKDIHHYINTAAKCPA
jgi:hypothetical protein